ncbi:hypothetical protein C2S52_006105 [Perilla frutescens var. hirtella]|nr:hypothetical protein C2S52_006105 [Perilla frutescens var. hirtella]
MPLLTLPVNGGEEFSVETRHTSPANLLMKIESFSLLSKYGICKYESREFGAGGYKWKITIYPEGHESDKKQGGRGKKKEEDGEHVCVCLSASGTKALPVDWEIDAIFTFLLYDQISNSYVCFRGMSQRFNALNPKWRISKLISKKSLMDSNNGYVVDDNSVFGAEVFVIKSQRINECLSLLKETAPCKRDWKLSSFSKLLCVWNSGEFVVGNHKWNVVLYPKGNAKAQGRYISIFLECSDAKSFAPHQKLKAEFLMRIKSKLHNTHHSENLNHWFTLSQPTWGRTEFIAIGEMSDPSKGILVDDCCFLEIEISVQAVVLDAPNV